MGRVQDVAAAYVAAVVAAIDEFGVLAPAASPVGYEWPDAKLIDTTTAAGGYIIGIVPVEPSRPTPRGRTVRVLEALLPQTLTVTVVGTNITFGGTIGPGIGLHVFVDGTGGTVVDVSLVTGAKESLGAFIGRVATALATSTSAPDVTATATNRVVAVGGTSTLAARIAADASAALRVNRITQRLQLTLWAPNEALRGDVSNAIIACLGTQEQRSQWLPIGDGTVASCTYVSGPRPTDEKLEDRSLKRADIMFDAGYDVLRPTKMTRIVAISTTTDAGDETKTALTSEVSNNG